MLALAVSFRRMPEMLVPSPFACCARNAPILVDEPPFHPSRVHEDYSLPGSVRWADGTWEKVNSENSKKGPPPPPIQAALRWQWLGLDVKGPLPRTRRGHTHVLTAVDFYSKWVEACPLRTPSARAVALHLHALVCRLGSPRRILSQMDRAFVDQVNQALKTHLSVETCSLVVYHPDTCALDPLTHSYIDSMVLELVKDHGRSWDVQLPASLLSLRCREHPSTRYSPFYMLYCREPCTDRHRRQPLIEDQLVNEERTPTQSPSGAQGPGSELTSARTAESVSALDLLDVEEVLVVQCERCSGWAWIPRAQTRQEAQAYTCAACGEATRRRTEPAGQGPPKTDRR